MIEESVITSAVSGSTTPTATAIPAAKATTVAAVPTATAIPAAKATTVAAVPTTTAIPAVKAATVAAVPAVKATGVAATLKGILLSPMFGIVALGGIIAFEIWQSKRDIREIQKDK